MSVIGTRELAAALRSGDTAPLWRWLERPAPGAYGPVQRLLGTATHLTVVAAGGRDRVPTRGWIASDPHGAVCADRGEVTPMAPTLVARWLVERIDLGVPAQRPLTLAPAAVDVAVLDAALDRGAADAPARTVALQSAWAHVLGAVESWWTVEGGPLTRAPVRVDTLVTPGGLVAVDRSGSAARLATATPWSRLTAALVALCLDPDPARGLTRSD